MGLLIGRQDQRSLQLLAHEYTCRPMFVHMYAMLVHMYAMLVCMCAVRAHTSL